MRVVLAMTASSPGGVWRHVADLAAGLRRRDVDVAIALDPRAGRLVAAARRRDLPWMPLDAAGRDGCDVWHLHLHNTYEVRAFRMMAARIRRLGARVATEHLPHSNASDPRLLPGPRTRGSHAAKTAFKRLQYRMLDRVIAVSDESRAFLSERYGGPPANVVVVGNGVAPDPPPPAASTGAGVRVVAAGSLISQKGFDILVEARRLASADWTVEIAGEGSARARLEKAIAAVAGPPRVALLGWRDDVGALMASADIVCVPSRWEAAPYVALDAMVAARPVIASAIDGLRDIVVPGRTGTLVAPEDPHALGRAIDAYAENPELRRRMGMEGRRRVEAEFGLDRMVEGTLRVYEDAIAERRGR